MVRRPADLTLRVGVGMQAELTSGRIRFESATLLTYIKLIDFNPCCLDDSLPFFRIRAQKLRKLVWERAPDYVRIASQLLDERWFYESFGKITTYLLHNFIRRLGWRKDALPRVNHITWDTRLGDGRYIRCCWGSLGACRGKDADLARPRIGKQFAAAEIAVNPTWDEVSKCWRSAAIRRVCHLKASHLQKQQFGKMWAAPGAGRSHNEFSRLRFHIVDKLRDRLGRRRIRHEHKEWELRDQRYRAQVHDRTVIERAV